MTEFLNKNRDRRGYTLMELIIVIGIIAILAAFAILGLPKIRLNTRQKELDSKAEMIFTAAQSRLTELRTSGRQSVYRDGKDPVTGINRMPAGYTPINAQDEDYAEGEMAYHIAAHSSALTRELLPSDRVEIDVWNGHWVIELNYLSGTVYGVWYSEQSLQNGTYAYSPESFNAYRTTSVRRDLGAVIGYFGRGTARIKEPANAPLNTRVNIENGEKLIAHVTIKPERGKRKDKISLNYTIYQLDEKRERTGAASDSVTISDIAPEGNVYKVDIILDSLENTGLLTFAQQFGAKLTPGENMEIEINYATETQSHKSRNTAQFNSLFADTELNSPAETVDNSVAHITSGRHLQNLDNNSVESVKQTSAIVEKDIDFAAAWAEVYANDSNATGYRSFSPIVNSKLRSFDGNGKKIKNILLGETADGVSGLFKGITGNLSVKNIVFVDATAASTSGAAGTLAGSIGGGSVQNITLQQSQVGALTHAGALAGSMNSGSVDKVTLTDCTVTNKDTGAHEAYTAGGIVGNFTGGTISNVDSTNAAVRATNGSQKSGGFAGSMSGSARIDGTNSLKNPNVQGSRGPAGGAIGQLSGTSGIYNVTVTRPTVFTRRNAGGFVGEITSDVTLAENASTKDHNITVIGAKVSAESIGYAGGFAGSVKGQGVMNISSVNIVGTKADPAEIKTTGGGPAGGFIAVVNGSASESNRFSNIRVGGTSTADASFTVTASGGGASDASAGGFAGNLTNTVKINGIDVVGVSVAGKKYVGGAIGNGNYVQVDGGFTISGVSVTSSGGDASSAAGGFAGFLRSGGTILKNIRLTDTITVKNSTGSAGGFAGTISAVNEISDIIVGTNTGDAASEKKLTVTAQAGPAGGFAGKTISENDNTKLTTKIDTVKVYGASVTSNTDDAGGFAGKLEYVTTLTNITVAPNKGYAVSIASYGAGNAGGIAGTMTNNRTIGNITLKDAVGIDKTITATANGTGHAGGLAGSYTGTGSDTLTSINISRDDGAPGITIKSLGGTAGGIAGTMTKLGSLNGYGIERLSISAAKEAGGFAGVMSDCGSVQNGSKIIATTVTAGKNYNVGGFAGTIDGANTVVNSLGNINATSTIKTSGTGNAGGFAGEVVKAKQLTGIKVDGSGAGGKTIISEAGCVGGFAGKLCNTELVKNDLVNSKVVVSATSGAAGGFAGFTSNTNFRDIMLDTNSDSSVRSESGNVGGFAGEASAITTVKEAQNGGSVVIQRPKLYAGGAGHVGGFVGVLDGASSNIDRVNVLGSAVVSATGTGNAGGLVGTIRNAAKLSKCRVGNLSEGAGDPVISAASGAAGGFAGLIEKADEIYAAYIKSVSVSSSSGNAGGLVGEGKQAVIKSITADDADAGQFDALISGVTVTAGKNAGGFAGYINSSAFTAENPLINGTNSITASSNGSAGGFAGRIDSASRITNVRIGSVDDDLITNIASNSGAVGGMVGTMASTNGMDNCTANRVACTTENGAAGGVIGELTAAGELNACSSIDSIAKSTNGAAGGVIGRVSAKANVRYCSAYLLRTIPAFQSLGANAGVAPISAPNAGGFVGEIASAGAASSFSQSFAATLVNGVTVGGFVGNAKANFTLNESYADCYLFGTSTSGLIGAIPSGSTATVTNCYAAGYLYGENEAGISLNDGNVAISKSYTIAVPFEGKNFYATVKTLGSANKSTLYFGHLNRVNKEKGIGTQMDEDDTTLASKLGSSFRMTSGSTVPYNIDGGVREDYAFPRISNCLTHYGDWDSNIDPKPIPVKEGFVYYEYYENGAVGLWYCDGTTTYNSLKNKLVVGDGYGMMLSADFKTSDMTVTERHQTSAIRLASSTLGMVDRGIIISDAGDEYRLMALPQSNADSYEASQYESEQPFYYFYKIELKRSRNTDKYYYFCNPRLAKCAEKSLLDIVLASAMKGGSKDTYYIRSARQLYNLSCLYNSWTMPYGLISGSGWQGDIKGATFNQECEIDYNKYGWAKYTRWGTGPTEQYPIGYSCPESSSESRTKETKPFIGTYDGQYNTIKNITFRAKSNDLAVGLFGYIGSDDDSATVKNLNLTNDTLKTIKAVHNTGVFVGCVGRRGTVQNCTVSGFEIDATNITPGKDNENFRIGGFAGSCHGKGSYIGQITNCMSNIPKISVLKANADGYVSVGGFIGLSSGKITNSFCLANIIATGDLVASEEAGTTESTQAINATRDCLSGFCGVGYVPWDITIFPLDLNVWSEIRNCYCATSIVSDRTISWDAFAYWPGSKVSNNYVVRNLVKKNYNYYDETVNYDDIQIGGSLSGKVTGLTWEELLTRNIGTAYGTVSATKSLYKPTNKSGLAYPASSSVKDANGDPVFYGDWPTELKAVKTMLTMSMKASAPSMTLPEDGSQILYVSATDEATGENLTEDIGLAFSTAKGNVSIDATPLESDVVDENTGKTVGEMTDALTGEFAGAQAFMVTAVKPGEDSISVAPVLSAAPKSAKTPKKTEKTEETEEIVITLTGDVDPTQVPVETVIAEAANPESEAFKDVSEIKVAPVTIEATVVRDRHIGIMPISPLLVGESTIDLDLPAEALPENYEVSAAEEEPFEVAMPAAERSVGANYLLYTAGDASLDPAANGFIVTDVTVTRHVTEELPITTETAEEESAETAEAPETAQTLEKTEEIEPKSEELPEGEELTEQESTEVQVRDVEYVVYHYDEDETKIVNWTYDDYCFRIGEFSSAIALNRCFSYLPVTFSGRYDDPATVTVVLRNAAGEIVTLRMEAADIQTCFIVTYMDGDTILKQESVPFGEQPNSPTAEEFNAARIDRRGFTYAPVREIDADSFWDSSVAPQVYCDLTIRALRTENRYHIRFDGNGGEGGMNDFDMLYTERTMLPQCAFMNGALEFKGWAIEPHGEAVYGDRALVSGLCDKNEGILTLYAVWGEAVPAPESEAVTVQEAAEGE